MRLYPDRELHKTWKRWLAAYRFIYNWAISQLKKPAFRQTVGFNGDLQKACRADEFIPEWVRELPGHQLQEACDEAFDAYRQAKKNGGIPKFKSCRNKRQTIQFKVGNYLQGKWYPRLTKGMNFFTKQPWPKECIYGTELVYEKGDWYGCFPEYREPKLSNSSQVIAIDPGNRTFITGYDGANILEIGKGDIGQINRLCSHLDQLMSKTAKSVSKRQRYQMRKAANRLRKRISNLVKDLHNKAVHYLVNNYKVIFLPTFETSSMVLKSKRKINSKSARNMLTWSHYKFSQNLQQSADRKGVSVIRCNEAYTSKTCTNCGHVHHKLGGFKVFNCPNCGTKIDRDFNGARNIMLRALLATAFTVSPNADGSAILSLGF